MSALETPWPRQVNGMLIEPLSGWVRLRWPGRDRIELPAYDVRALAEAAPNDCSDLLIAAAAEAERQAGVLYEAMVS